MDDPISNWYGPHLLILLALSGMGHVTVQHFPHRKTAVGYSNRFLTYGSAFNILFQMQVHLY